MKDIVMNERILLNKSVLVAEDNAVNQMVVRHTLIKMGAGSDIASNGEEAIEKLQNSDYDLILMDIQMPQMDGYETTAYIRTQLKSDIPIIAMTAFALNGEDEKCYEHGMNGYVSKPFTIESLGNVIQKVLTLPAEVSNNPHIIGNKNVAVDLSMLYDTSDGDTAYIHTMIQTFLENMPVTIEKIVKALEVKDWVSLYKAAHFAKSSLSVVNVSEMYDWTQKVEVNARNMTNLGMIPELVEKIKEKFNMAEQVLIEKFGAELPVRQ